MTLQVSADQFFETLKRRLTTKEVFVACHEVGSILTSSDPEKGFVLAAFSPHPVEAVQKQVESADLTFCEGNWTTDGSLVPLSQSSSSYLASVAYRSAEDKPGLWVDAYPTLPAQMTVLRNMFDEFRETGEMEHITFEEFLQLANPNVVILSPAEVAGFLDQKVDC